MMIADIKKGFLMGIGLIVPLLLVEFLAIKYSFNEMMGVSTQAYTEFFNEFNEEDIDVIDEEAIDSVYQEFEKSYIDKISLSAVNETKQGIQLLITGQFTNNSEKSINSLEIEAELFDEDGKFVYECSKSFYEKKAAGITENYLITCGCSENGIPEYKTATVRVVKASSY